MARSTGWSGPGRPRRPHKLQVQPLLQGQQDHWLEAVARPEALSPWSHDIDKELTGVPHGLLEGLAAACQLWGDSGQLPDRRPPRRPAHHRVYAFVRGCSGGSPGAAAEAWLRGLLPRLSWPAGRSRQPPLPTPLGTVWSDSLPLPPAPADRLSFSRPRARRLLPPALRVDPLLLLPGVKKGGEEWDGQCRALPLPRWPAIARTTRGRAWWS